MEKVLGIGGFFFRSKDPETLARWYTDHLGIDISDAVWNQNSGQTIFSPMQHDTDYFGRPEQQWMINFRVANLDAFVTQLQSQGIDVERRPGEWDSEFGKFGRIHDLDGNPIELWETSDHT